jgi:hypothetical protein
MHGPQSILPIGYVTAESARADGASHIARDCVGLNFYEIDRGLRDTGGGGYHYRQNFPRSPAQGQTGVNSAP